VSLPGRRRPSGLRGPAGELRRQRREVDVLDQLLDAVRGGAGRALVMRGEPGVGKTALLDYLAEHASGCRVVRATGVQSEMALTFAGLHQLCAPMLDRLQRLPAPQRAALRSAFGLGPGSVPDRFLVGLATLSLLADTAEQHPLVCLVDDEQWLDHASAQVMAFVARRLAAESVGLVFAARVPDEELAGLPELVVEGLQEAEARALLDAVLTGPLDARVRDRIVAEARGNPLALLELPRGLTPAELAGGFALPDAMPLAGWIEESFRRRLDALPADTRVLLQLAAADPVGDPVLVWRAAGRLGIAAEAATPAAEAGLLEVGARVRFRHPLVRSSAYRSASLPQLRGRRLQLSALEQWFPWRAQRVGAHREQITLEPGQDAGVLASLTEGSKVLGEGREQRAEDRPDTEAIAGGQAGVVGLSPVVAQPLQRLEGAGAGGDNDEPVGPDWSGVRDLLPAIGEQVQEGLVRAARGRRATGRGRLLDPVDGVNNALVDAGHELPP
jgi:AAA ATPase domain